VVPDGPLCGCGQRGCLEAVASRLAVAAVAALSAYRGEAPHVQKVAGTDLRQIRSSVLAEAIREGNEAIARIVDGATRQIGIAVAGAIHLMAPDVIILGGGLVAAMPDVFVKGVYTTAKERVMPAFKDTFSVVTAELGDDAGVRGAAAWARKTLAGD
jgi:glucokinase